ncbi:Cytochrome P450 89A2 [Morella rubra]|uniref:Cytochrome P450 89A2 n=1 Tax=Morella rubra TaxID=262757 RepID=A0A6A1UY74_9ROSI|nr:Cytochrome P450 89A2 [Morella rubra]
METWFIILVTLWIAALLGLLIPKIFSKKHKLPPGPLAIPVLGNFLWLRKSVSLGEVEPVLLNLHAKLGPMITLHIGSRPAIFVADHSIAHRALIQNGAVFADRPPVLPITKIVTSNQHNISSAFYGPTWRVLRRNLTSQILHPSRVKSYSRARKWILDIFVNRLVSHSITPSGEVVPGKVIEHFHYAMLCLLVLMCFGDKLSETQIKEIESVQLRILSSFGRFKVLNYWPTLGKILFRKRWDEFFELRRQQQTVLMPLIEARKRMKEERQRKAKENGVEEKDDEYVLSYVDTLLDLALPEEKKKLNEAEIVNMCSEFLNAGTHTTSASLQWIMANLVKYTHVRERLLVEIKGVIGEGAKEVKDEDLSKMPYLKAVVLEGLRRHPPEHLVLPHAVTEDTVLEGYLVPKNATVNFLVAEMAWDPKVWEDPLAFKPERFLSHAGDRGGDIFDIMGGKEIKMMPFGAGRRICPGAGLAIFHLEYFVANLVWKFDWKPDGGEVDLSENQEFTNVMKHPLKAYISPRTF